MLKEKEFIEIEYTARIKDTNELIDTTNEELAKKENVFNPEYKYGAKTICLGEGYIIPNLEKELIGKELNKKYVIILEAERAFGKKDPRLIKTESIEFLRTQKINPFPGLQLFDNFGRIMTIRSVNGGRVVIDYNHPLAGRDMIYEIEIKKIVIDIKEKIKCLIDNLTRLDEKDYDLEDNNIKLKITLPSSIKENIIKKAKELIGLEISI